MLLLIIVVVRNAKHSYVRNTEFWVRKALEMVRLFMGKEQIGTRGSQ